MRRDRNDLARVKRRFSAQGVELEGVWGDGETEERNNGMNFKN